VALRSRFRLHDPKKMRDGDRRTASVRLENAGTGTMAVDIAATRGNRFDKTGQPSAEYRESRARALLGKGQSQDLAITGPFEPESIIVDPDAKVLQLQRTSACEVLTVGLEVLTHRRPTGFRGARG